ncbi:MAG: TatD family hydrolase [Candidatus Marinimicrobia bacterium]|nr:TatD family hydrolase [Candidatus Neomarinimicrobiota bacterium]
MIDSHAHINAPQFRDDLEAVIRRAIAVGIEKIIVPGYDLPTSLRAMELAKKHDLIFATAGIHPHDASKSPKNYLNLLEQYATDEKVVAIGESGLDFFRNLSEKNVQIMRFSEQLELAKSLNLPIIIHNRNADDDTIETVENIGNTHGVLHCFSGSQRLADWAIERGFFLSFTGIITFSDEHHGIIRNAPKDKICIETDCPWLTPAPHRGKRNEPENVKFVLEKLAEIWEMPVEETDIMATFNTERLFPKIAK